MKKRYIVTKRDQSRRYDDFYELFQALRDMPGVQVEDVQMHDCLVVAGEADADRLAIALGPHYTMTVMSSSSSPALAKSTMPRTDCPT